MFPLSSSPPEYTVSELSFALKKLVETGFSNVRVRGEISGLKRHTSGHMYFALKDETAVLDGVCWRGTAQGMSVPLQEGLQVIACGRLTTYPGRSKYQIVVERVEPAGEGALLKLLEERKRKLTAEGLFDDSRKKNLPFLPQLIGIITSPTGAVIRDMLHRLADRFPVPILLWPVAVQGEGAASQVAAAIRGFNALPSGPDLLIVARGGGSLEDLWAFNEEDVVRATAESRIPLISAIGHETDVTLIDFAADKRAPTPTAAAEFAVPLRSQVAQTLAQYHARLTTRIHHLLSLHASHLEALRRGLPPLKTWLETTEQKIDDYTERLMAASVRVIDKQELLFTSFSQQLCPAFTNFIDKTTHKVDILFQLLDSYSYAHTLKRGFSFITTFDQTLLPSKAKASSAEQVQLHFYDGTLEATLLKTSAP